MANFGDVARMAQALPQVTEGERHGNRSWFVGSKAFAWERPFRKADLKRFGTETPPDGPILAITVEDLADKEAVLAAHPTEFFDIAHFQGYPAILVQLKVTPKQVLRDAILDGWLVVAPEALARQYLEEHGPLR